MLGPDDHYVVISADTHPVTGAFTYSVGAPSATHVAAFRPASDTLVSSLFAVVRWLEYLCYALLGGGVAFLIVCWPDGGGRRGVTRLITASRNRIRSMGAVVRFSPSTRIQSAVRPAR